LGNDASRLEECVTKGWEAKDICDKMAQLSFTREKFTFAGEFTSPSKRRAAPMPAWHHRAMAIAILFAVGEPASAFAQIGPTSSTSVEISLSVSAKYGLMANEAGITAIENGAADFCMTTNGKPMDLPVQLVRRTAEEAAAKQMFKEVAVQLDWCAAGRLINSIHRGNHREGAALLIVRPE